MATDRERYDLLRAAVHAELVEPGAVTRAELAALLNKHPALAPAGPAGPPPAGDYDDIYDPTHYA